MSAQQREPGKNFIGLVSDSCEEQRAIESLTKSNSVLRGYLIGLMAAVLHRRGDRR